MKRWLLLLLLVLFVSGCRGFGAALLLTAVVLHTASHTHHEHPQVVYVSAEQPPLEPGPIVVMPPPSRDEVVEVRTIPFNARQARTGLAGADFQACRTEGAPRGYGHAAVTFGPSGNVTRVVIDRPGGLTPQAVNCLGRELGKVTVSEFTGQSVTVGTTFLVP